MGTRETQMPLFLRPGVASEPYFKGKGQGQHFCVTRNRWNLDDNGCELEKCQERGTLALWEALGIVLQLRESRSLLLG